MEPHKFVIKCGNFAVLVDLYVLPLGGRGDASWFTPDHIEEVAALVRDPVDRRVTQYTEFLHNRRQWKQKKELAPASAFSVKVENFSLVANFLKRHSSLRCLVKRDLRVFPERYVVCASRAEDASAHHGNPSLAVTEPSEQSRSAYFSSVGETQELLNSSAKTKKTALQKIAQKASVQQEQQRTDGRSAEEPETSPTTASISALGGDHKGDTTDAVAQIGSAYKQEWQAAGSSAPNGVNLDEASADPCQREIGRRTGERSAPGDAGEDPRPRRAKRTCLGRPPADCAAQTTERDLLPPTPLPPVEAKAESKASPVSECTKTTLEVELLTPGKRAQRLPLASNNTAQTNQNRLAASLRGLSVKPASSAASIGSRSALAEEGSENAPRTSRLRRLKKS